MLGYITIEMTGDNLMNVWIAIALIVAASAICLLVGYMYRKNVAEAKVAKAEDAVKKLYEDARTKASEIKKEMILEAKEEVFKVRTEAEKENRERRSELQRTERRLFQREESIEKKLDGIEQREKALADKEADVDRMQADIAELHAKQMTELETISGMSMDAA